MEGNNDTGRSDGLLDGARPSALSEIFTSHVRKLQGRLPHLTNVLQPSRYRSSYVSFYDYIPGGLSPCPRSGQRLHFNDGPSALRARRFISLLLDQRSDVCTRRLILIDDVCQDLVACISTVFGMSPEVCEEHLIKSGWGGTYEESESLDWFSRRSAKDHISFKWHRPTRVVFDGLNEESLPLSREHVFSQPGRGELKDRQGRLIETALPQFSPLTNIWRRYIDLRPLATGPLKTEDIIAREERVTIWRKQIDGLLFGTLHCKAAFEGSLTKVHSDCVPRSQLENGEEDEKSGRGANNVTKAAI